LSDVLDVAARAGHRLFVVAVGSAPNEALAREVAERTGGACEFVAPNEDAEAVIVRMFRRLREAPKRVARVEWPVAPTWEAPLPVALFSGDSLHLLAGFATPPSGDVRVVVSGLTGGDVTLTARLAPALAHAVLPRLAAARRLAALDAEEAGALAERYQLASAHTSFVVVEVRDAAAKAAGLPKVAKVPQMLAAGWGGTGDVTCFSVAPPLMAVRASPSEFSASRRFRDSAQFDLHDPVVAESVSPYPGSRSQSLVADITPVDWLARLVELQATGAALPTRIADIAVLGLPTLLVERLEGVVSLERLDDAAEARLVRLWIALLARSPAGDALAPDARAALIGDVLADRNDRELRRQLAGIVSETSADRWPSVPALLDVD
jgi:Ca-activated chloride channel homolog